MSSSLVSTQLDAEQGAPRKFGGNSLNLQIAIVCLFIAVMNQIAELKDRDVYEHFYGLLDGCTGLGCLLVSEHVRSPIFRSIIVFGHRLGVSFDLLFTA